MLPIRDESLEPMVFMPLLRQRINTRKLKPASFHCHKDDKKGTWIFKPKVYWRRGQDMYEYIRNKPEIYRNLHVTNKIGAAFDTSVASDWGLTGVGVDISQGQYSQ